MAKRGLPTGIGLRHDAHYVEELARTHRTVGRIIPIHQIEPNPEQPRTEIGDLTDLSASIKEKGVLEPLLVKPNRQNGNWMIIAGERRWRAANLAGLKEVPCIELDIDEKGVAEIALIENLQRKDLTVWEEADGLAALADRFKYTHDEIAKKISKSRSTVTEFITIAGLPENIREKCVRAKINAKSSLLEIARQFDEDSMHKLLDELDDLGSKREEIRQKARPAASAKSNKIPTKQNFQQSASNTDRKGEQRNFRYKSIEDAATVEVIFDDPAVFSRDNLVKVLEETIRSLKETDNT